MNVCQVRSGLLRRKCGAPRPCAQHEPGAELRARLRAENERRAAAAAAEVDATRHRRDMAARRLLLGASPVNPIYQSPGYTPAPVTLPGVHPPCDTGPSAHSHSYDSGGSSASSYDSGSSSCGGGGGE